MRVGILCIFLLFCLSVLLTAIAWILLHIDGSIVTSVQGANPSGDDGAISRNYDVMIENDPTILFMMASYSFEQFLSLQNVLDNLRDICNSGWNVTVHLQVSAKGLVQTHPSLAILQDRMYCIRTNHHIPILIEEYGMVGFGLNSKHRTYAAAHIDDFDYFAYAEEDMLLTISHLAAYQSATKKLMKAFPDSWMRYQVGFLRYEDSVVGSTERVTWEYMPQQVHIVELGPPLGKYIFTNNLNQAIYIFPRRQLQDLEDRCEFLSKPGRNAFYGELRRAQDLDWKYMSVGVSEWSSSFQQVLQCGLRRIVPVEHFQLYMIHHGTNKAQKRRLRKELLTMHNWTAMVAEKSRNPITMQQAQNSILPQQYNLHLMDLERIRGKVKWSWE